MSEEAPPNKVRKIIEKGMRPIAMEVCCGHAGLSVSLQKRGWNFKPIDWVGNEHKTKIPVLNKDLTNPEQVEHVIRMVKRSSYVHIAPPCGTASKARDR